MSSKRPAPSTEPEPKRRYFHGRNERPCRHEPAASVEKDLYFLSNFYSSPIIVDGKQYATVEHRYQAAKFTDSAYADTVRTAKTPTLCKRLGRTRKQPIRANWDAIRRQVMRCALRAKFSQHPELRARLAATAPAQLHEDAPRDPYWGVCGEDMLGKLLMELRDESAE